MRVRNLCDLWKSGLSTNLCNFLFMSLCQSNIYVSQIQCIPISQEPRRWLRHWHLFIANAGKVKLALKWLNLQFSGSLGLILLPDSFRLLVYTQVYRNIANGNGDQPGYTNGTFFFTQKLRVQLNHLVWSYNRTKWPRMCWQVLLDGCICRLCHGITVAPFH